MENILSFFKPLFQFVAAVPIGILITFYVLGAFERTYQSNKHEKLCIQVFALNGFLLLHTLSFLFLAFLASFCSIQLVSFDWIKLDVPLLMEYNGHATLTFPPLIVLLLIGQLMVLAVSAWQWCQDQDKPDQESMIGILTLGLGLGATQALSSPELQNRNSQATCNDATASPSKAGNKGKGKGASTHSSGKSCAVTPNITSIGSGHSLPVTQNGSGILIQDGGLTQALPLGGNLYRSNDGRTWCLEPSGMTARHVATPPFTTMSNGASNYGATSFDGIGNGIGTGIALLPLLVIGGLAFAFLCIITVYIVAAITAVVTAIIMPPVIIDVEKLLLRCYTKLRLNPES